MEAKVKKEPKKKKIAKVAEPVEKEAKKEDAFSGEYFYGLGKRKTSIAQVRIYPNTKEEENFIINGRKLPDYFGLKKLQSVVNAPFVAIGQLGKFSVSVKVLGGGTASQAGAIRLGITRALVKADETLRKALKDLGYLTRDARIVERKKPGLKKARRAPQWAKR